MAHRITLLITKESVNVDSKIPHFYENGFLIIPFDDDGSEISQIEKLSDTYKTFDKIFEKYLDNFWKDDFFGESTEIADYKSLLLVELIMRLKLSDFLIYHYQESGIETYEHLVNFENKMVKGNGESKFQEINIDINDYCKYSSCERRYLNRIDNEQSVVKNEDIKIKKWYQFWNGNK